MRLVVDRLEGGVVIVTDGRRSFELPSGLFDAAVCEGDVIELSVRVDTEGSERARTATTAKREALSSDDDGGDFSL
jgi:hypothetical protein